MDAQLTGYHPANAAELCEFVRDACSRHAVLIARGGGSHDREAMPDAEAVHTDRLNACVALEPDDLVVTVEAGMRIDALQNLLRPHHLWLPIDGACDGRSTIGGLVAADVNGSGRATYGSIRDLLLAARAVTGKGVLIRSGSAVVKNVAGYDVHKVLVGSAGTLAILTELTFRAAAIPERRALARGPVDTALSIDALADAIAICRPTACAIVEQPGEDGTRAQSRSLVARFEGFAEDVDWQTREWGRRFPESEHGSLDGDAHGWEPINATLLATPDAVRCATGTRGWLDRPPTGAFALHDALAAVTDAPASAMRRCEIGRGRYLWRRCVVTDRHEPERRLSTRLKEAFDPSRCFPAWEFRDRW